jgi:hypothetical protein
MGIAALFNPEIFHVKLLAVSVRPKKIGIPLAHRDDVRIVYERNDPLLFRPNSRTIWIDVLTQATVE